MLVVILVEFNVYFVKTATVTSVIHALWMIITIWINLFYGIY